MLLGSRQYSVGDVRVIRVNYKDWLVPGYVLLVVTATTTPATGLSSTIGAVQLDPTEEIAFITLNCGSVVNENFTLNIQAKDTFGQTINDQLNVTVVTPGTT